MLRETVNHEALATLSPGAELELKVEGGGLRVYDRQGRPVGALDPQLALRLLLMQAEYPEAEPREDERDPFANEAPSA